MDSSEIQKQQGDPKTKTHLLDRMGKIFQYLQDASCES
jgi:hypothetical protein